MRICLLGDTSGNPDEGMKKIVANLSERLSLSHEVLTLSPLDAFRPKFWKKVRDFEPDVVHYVPGPSLLSFIILKTITLLNRPKLVVMSITLVRDPRLIAGLVRIFKPSLVLVQSLKMHKLLRESRTCVSFMSISGVDPNRFRPVLPDEKARLRERFNLDMDSFVILHVGHIKKGRNLAALLELQGEIGNQVVMVESTTTATEKPLKRRLAKSGIKMISGYQPNIEELYKAADCYVFPVESTYDSVELPLSVLEALAAGLPVVSTRFGGIADSLSEVSKDMLAIVDDIADIPLRVQTLKESHCPITPSDSLSAFSWDEVASRLADEYDKAIEQNEGIHQPQWKEL